MKVICDKCGKVVDQNDAIFIRCGYDGFWKAFVNLRTIHWRCVECYEKYSKK